MLQAELSLCLSLFLPPYDRLAHHQQTQHLMLQPITSRTFAVAVLLFRPLLLSVWVGVVRPHMQNLKT